VISKKPPPSKKREREREREREQMFSQKQMGASAKGY
jgi:hypothetical protein